MIRIKIALLPLLLFSVISLHAQDKQQYSSLGSALQAGFMLQGQSGPASVNWIQGGEQYSFISGKDIHTIDPHTLQENTVFSNNGLHIPGTGKAFDYESFQWSRDSKHLLFKTNFRHIFRRAGISDYYIYDIDSKDFRTAAKDARSAELSPDGSMVGMER